MKNVNKKAIERHAELVIDVTYECNSRCAYCQWATNNRITRPSKQVSPAEMKIDSRSLKSLGINRIVLSGGEPLLSPYFAEVVSYYKALSIPIRIVTNGILLTPERVETLLSMGISEFVISLDSLEPEIYLQTRGLKWRVLNQVVANIEYLMIEKGQILEEKRISRQITFVGINAVLSDPTCNVLNITRLLDFAETRGLDQVKFQPIFDDGYVSANAPNLMLNASHLNCINKIKWLIRSYLARNEHRSELFTNLPSFWQDLGDLVNEKHLDPKRCEIPGKKVLLHAGYLKFCFWCQHSVYGHTRNSFTLADVINSEREFKNQLTKCNVLPQCFCMQPINHSWK
ncbi:MAG: radical SAM protein [Candidatus Helarchaeales archaeon]